VNVESRSFQCETRLCLAANFQGRVSCPYGQSLAGGASAKNITSRYDGTALIAAAHLGHDGVVRRLIAAGAPLDHVNNLGWTCLLEIVILGDGGPRHVEVAQLVLAAGANTNIADKDGVSPLAHAKRKGQREIAQLIANVGGRVSVQCNVYDADAMGYTDAESYVLDTTQAGNSKAGHDYGTNLSSQEKLELIEFLKSL
jgi:ankyrin repeat protein